MKRTATGHLNEWAGSPTRKPLLLRGARQVGKTHLVRQFAAGNFEDLIELNFEKDPSLVELFADLSPKQITSLLEMRFAKEIRPGKSLLFFDEIQAAPRAIQALRYFKEEAPSQHVVAAGSLLDFVFGREGIPAPVGRVEYLYLKPMNFTEFLDGVGQKKLADYIKDFQLGDRRSVSMHHHMMMWLRRYIMVGGMPEVVQAYRDTGSFGKVDQMKEALLATYRDDFGKYRGRMDDGLMRLVFNKIPGLVGEKLKYVKVARDIKATRIADVLERLCRAGVMYKVIHSSANGIPLGAESNPRVFKPLFLDIGLMLRASGLNMTDLNSDEQLMMVNRGAVAEQIVGQEMLAAGPIWEERHLFYWMREKKTASAEVDYLISNGPTVIPVEVKAGSTGRLKSLHVFLHEKNCRFGLRLGTGPAQLTDVDLKLPTSQHVSGRLLSLPLYLAGEIERLVATVY